MTEIQGWAADADALAAFLAEPNLARIGTIDAHGDPHLVPVWFGWDGTRFLVVSDAGDHKVENVRRSGRVSLEIDSDLRRKRGVLVRGVVRLVEGPEARARAQAVSELQLPRYRPDASIAETAARMASRGEPVVIELEPRTIVSWGR